MKKALRIIGSLLCVLLVVYIGLSVYISISVKGLINDINNSNSYDTSHFSDESIADEISVRKSHDLSSYNATTIHEKFEFSFPVFLHYFIGGQVYYNYTYEATDGNNELLTRSSDIPVTLTIEMDGLNWIITDIHEEP